VPISLASRLRGSVGAQSTGIRAPAAAKKKTQPGRIPPGYYDPSLDAAERASGRGLGDLRLDIERDEARASTGYLQTTQRAGEDYGTFTGRVGEDHATNSGMLARAFRQLGQQQAGMAVSQGLTSGGGTFAAARAARQENQGLEQRQLDTGRDRTLADALRANSRLMEDAGTQYQYGVSDRATGLQRAERENTLFGQDTQTLRAHQAAAAGYVPPKPAPKTAAQKASAYKDPTRKRGDKTEYQWPNGSWHSTKWRGN
jgi:hypothetical protein